MADSATKRTELQRPDGVGRRRDYFGSSGAIDAGAQAFLVELPYPGATVLPHFHDVDQFQVVVAGNGRIGKKRLSPVTFQYADAYTPYGPIVANDDGISFFTLRNVASGGHFKMPGSRHLMPCRAGRNIAGGFDLSQPVPAAGECREDTLMVAQDDGVLALGIRLGPNAARAAIDSDAGGQYYLVCAGSLVVEDEELPTNSLLRIERGEPSPALAAGAEGASVLALQFGRATDRPGSNPAQLAARDPSGYVRRT